MSSRRYPPAHLRYFKARLLNLTRPAFWGTAIFLSITGLAIREFWVNPELLTGNRTDSTVVNPNSRLSSEERAIAADIDNLPVLFFDFEQAVLPVLSSSKAQSNQKNNKSISQKALEDNQQETKTKAVSSDIAKVSGATINNPFLKQAENLLKLESIQSGNSWKNTTQAASSNDQNQHNNTLVNPLQAELNPATYPNYSSMTGKITTQTPLEIAINQSRNSNQNNLNSFNRSSGLNTYPTNQTTNSNPSYPNNSGYSQPLNQNRNFSNGNNPLDYSSTVNNQPVTALNSNNIQVNPNDLQSNPINLTNNIQNQQTTYSTTPPQPTTNYAPILTGR